MFITNQHNGGAGGGGGRGGWLLYGQKEGGAHGSPLCDAMFMTI